MKLSEGVAKALMAAKGKPLSVEVPGFDRRVVVEQSEHDAAMAALALQTNVEMIREGVADLEAGRVMPLDEAMGQIRRELGFPGRQKCEGANLAAIGAGYPA